MIDQPRIIGPIAVTVEPLFVTRVDAARMLCLSTVELDKLRAAGKIVPRRYGRRVLFPLDELRRFAASLPADDLGA
ncbi:helix-turn-helix domain-containing protein [Mycolicibacterium sp. P9-64]|uniref:helix-turn-helix domain-containing protein n=1 Tax=Mycolicibacterium sp. P9-64 TaxID=2024612 RepID=UPI0018D731AD|nr:helix-turn-helix domain-containing protein [Mycolicibacterium sp. P9-64]